MRKEAVIIVMVLVIVGLLFGNQRDEDDNQQTTSPSPATPAATEAGSSAATETMPTATPSTPTREGRGEEETEEAPADGAGKNNHTASPDAQTQADAVEVARRFIAAWLLPEPQQRRRQLEGIATPALQTKLAKPVRTWNTTPQGEPEVQRFEAMSAMIQQRFTDGRSVDLLLSMDPALPLGWSVQDVQPSTK